MMRTAWTGRQLQHKSEQIWHLEQQAKAHRMNLKRAREKIASLTDQLADAMQAQVTTNPLTSPADVILRDILQNRSRDPGGRRYSRETLLWARQIHDISPAAWEAIRAVLPLPSVSLLHSKFAAIRSAVSHALLEVTEIGSLLHPWMRDGHLVQADLPVVLAVDAVAFRPSILVSEDGSIEGLNGLTHCDPDVYESFVGHPRAFVTFLEEHWADAYSSLFVFQIQPTNPDLPCGIIHVIPALNGKGTINIVKMLFHLKELLENHFQFRVCGLAFDGDSCFNETHERFQQTWLPLFSDVIPVVPEIDIRTVIISDPLHLLKRIRYRWVKSAFSMGLGNEQLFFSTKRIEEAGFLSPVVFMQGQATKMHDSLPLRLFSPLTLSVIFQQNWLPEFAMAPWCLLTAALTIPDLSTRTRIELLEVGFWFLYFYSRLRSRFRDPPGVIETVREGRRVSLYGTGQIRDALNTFIALIVILRGSASTISLNRLGSGPLEHAFGKARTRCRDVNTMQKLIASFTSATLNRVVDACLQLSTVPQRRISFGIDCAPCSRLQRSIFDRTPKEIAASLLQQTGVDQTRLDFGLAHVSDFHSEPWKELYRIPAFCADTRSARPTISGSSASTGRPGVISSDQIFLGIIASPRAIHLLSAHSAMRQALDPELLEIDRALGSMFGRRLTVRDLELRVNVISEHLEEGRPRGRSREDLLQWLRANWSEARPLLLREFLGHTEFVLPDDK